MAKGGIMTALGGHQRPQLGSKNGNAKLNEQDVEIIRFRAQKKRDEIKKIDEEIEKLMEAKNKIMKSDSIGQMSLDFEVSESTIKNVLYNKNLWGHV
jgi:hypothetical protein